jgi:serine protease Do
MNIKSMAAIGVLGVGALVFTASNGATAASPAPQACACDGQQNCDNSSYMDERAAELRSQLQALKANALAMKDGEAQTLQEEAQELKAQLMAQNGAALQELKELRQGMGTGQGSGWGQGVQVFSDDEPRSFWADSESQDEEPGWLGVETEGIDADRAKQLKLPEMRGVYLSEVEEDSPAAKAGLRKGDVVLEFNGEHVEGTVQFRRLIREIPAGHTIQISVWRDGRSQSIGVTLGSAADSGSWDVMNPMPTVAPMPPVTPRAPRAFSFSMPNFEIYAGAPAPTIGISAEDLSGQLGDYFGAPDGEGVLITEVESGTPAEKAGLKAGDVVTKVAGERVRNLGEMRDRLRDKRDDKTVQITVLRKGSEQTLTVEPMKPQTHNTMGRRATF